MMEGHSLPSMRQPSFFKVFLPNLSTERLRIPIDFFKHLEGKTSGTVSLMGPSGNTWHVELVRSSDGCLFFEDCWPVFVRDHCVQRGDFFVFKYVGNLHFTVLVFDTSGCEKESAFCVKCSQDTTFEFAEFREKNRGIKAAEEDLNASLCKIFGGVPKRKIRNSPQAHSDGMTKNMADKFDDIFITKTYQGSAFNNGKKRYRQSRMSFGVKDEAGQQHLPFRKTKKVVTIRKDAVAQKRIKIENVNLPMHERNSEARDSASSQNERANSWNAAGTFTSNFPYFARCMAKHNVRKLLNVPSCFSRANFRGCNNMQIIFRNTEGRSWIVKLVCINGGSFIFSAGWIAFIRDNKVKTGDTLIFELVGKAEMNVHIFSVCQGSNICG